ncbi:MAG: hypothetical protein U0234_23555 [Sandaracinus sp.]
MTHPWVAVLIAIAVLIAPVAGSAQDATPSEDDAAVAEAREHFRVAMTHYEAGRFREAAAEFQRSYDLSHRPELLHNIYLSRRDMGDIRGAVDALRLYLTEATIPEADRTTLVHRLHGMESSLGQAPSAEPVPRATTETAEAGPTETTEATPTEGETTETETTETESHEDRSLLASPTPAPASSDVTSEGWFWALVVTAGVLVVGGVVAGAVVATTPGDGVQGDVGGRIMTLTF